MALPSGRNAHVCSRPLPIVAEGCVTPGKEADGFGVGEPGALPRGERDSGDQENEWECDGPKHEGGGMANRAPVRPHRGRGGCKGLWAVTPSAAAATADAATSPASRLRRVLHLAR